jgi:DNA-binding MarR family transcriptional regulator
MIPAVRQAALDKGITGRTMQIYVYLTEQLDVSDFRPIKLTGVAHAMRFRRSHLSDAITLLLERGYLEARQDREDERRRTFRLVYSLPNPVTNRAA